MRRPMFAPLLAITLAACGGSAALTPGSPSMTAATPPTAASSPPPTAAAALTNPPATPIPGCLPKCWFGHITQPGALEGDYQTKYFFGGQMTVHVPNLWWGFEDSTGELSLGKEGREDFRVLFALDLYVVGDTTGTPDEAFDRSAEGIMRFVEQQQGFEILDRGPASIGTLAGEGFEYERAADAKNQDPECPEEIQPCIIEYGYPEWDGYFGEGGDFHSRIVISKATWGGQTHAVYAIFWADNHGSYDEMAETARAIVESTVLPTGVESAPLSAP